MSRCEIGMIVLSTNDIDESIAFYRDVLGFPVKFRDGDRFAALDSGSVTLALATSADHPLPGTVVVGIKTSDVDRVAETLETTGGGIVNGPYNATHERRAVAHDHDGNGLVFYSPLSG